MTPAPSTERAVAYRTGIGICCLIAMACSVDRVVGQPSLKISNGLIDQMQIGQGNFRVDRPLVSYQIGKATFNSSQTSGLRISVRDGAAGRPEWIITFQNGSKDTLNLHNVVPFAPTGKDVYITGKGDHRLSRTHLFLPGRSPVNVIVPDNAWELGYSSILLGDSLKLFGLVRRDVGSLKKGSRRRFETVLFPGGSVDYHIYAESFTGPWQEGMRKCFQEHKLYDLVNFEETLYKREDLQWIRRAYVMHLMMAWDKDYFDAGTKQFNWRKFIERGSKLYGGDDVICLWPTWPTLGLDARNQFDMYRDLPGGLPLLRAMADTLRRHQTKFFIAYNPWDESTRSEGHLQGLADLIRQTSADGVVLDTKGESSTDLQRAADKVRPGVVMYSEGMAVPKDMPGIVSGRVHNALYYPPMLNLNKLIRPDFAIFRVAEVFKEPIQREYALSFFNGYGTEINQFAPGHPEWEEGQYRFLGQTSRILRENSSNFTSNGFTPLIPTTIDSIWVNRWPAGEPAFTNKTIYTILSLKTEGFKGPLMEIEPRSGYHWLDIWHHRETTTHVAGGRAFIVAEVDGFNRSFLGSNNEGQVTCLAELPSVLACTLDGNLVSIESPAGKVVKIWAGDPAYDRIPVAMPLPDQSVKRETLHLDLARNFGRYEGKIVVQVFENEGLLDETILYIKPGSPRLISEVARTDSDSDLSGMVKIPGGEFLFKTIQGDEFIPYPTQQLNKVFSLPAFYADRFPVTNEAFRKFIEAARYRPTDSTNFLKHWIGGKIPPGQERFPVVYVSYEDALTYAQWAGKRLPTELEWQYAAQAGKQDPWPWRQVKPVTRKEQFVTETLTVSTLEGIDAKNCNLGDGKPYAVGRYPRGRNAFGLEDLVGCVWQITNDLYESGSYRYIILKGGSFFKPSSSWWYVQGGPRELTYRQALLRVSQGFERNATVGFRCVKD